MHGHKYLCFLWTFNILVICSDLLCDKVTFTWPHWDNDTGVFTQTETGNNSPKRNKKQDMRHFGCWFLFFCFLQNNTVCKLNQLAGSSVKWSHWKRCKISFPHRLPLSHQKPSHTARITLICVCVPEFCASVSSALSGVNRSMGASAVCVWRSRLKIVIHISAVLHTCDSERCIHSDPGTTLAPHPRLLFIYWLIVEYKSNPCRWRTWGIRKQGS